MKICNYFKNFKPTDSQREHAKCVEKLSLNIFNQLKNFQELNFDNAEKLISYSALLHDIGNYISNKKIKQPHNKTGAKLILENKIDDLNESETKIVATAVRYHRGSHPKEGKHKLFSTLDENEKDTAAKIASIIRIADALDFNHNSLIDNLILSIDYDKQTLTIKTEINIMFNVGLYESFKKKKTLFEKVFGLKVYLND